MKKQTSWLKRLIAASLYGDGLVRLDTKKSIARYNACLKELGIEPTALVDIHIDGAGWSPEVAQEKGNTDYLAHGLANPLAVIATPSQHRKPIYFPVHSFDRDLLEWWFAQHASAIADVTTTTCLALELDQSVSRYDCIEDLLDVTEVVVRAHAGSLTEDARAQQELIDRFRNEPEGWNKPEVRQGIIESARTVGDLRSRRIDIPETTFDASASFFTRALGGVFVLRDVDGSVLLVVACDPDAVQVRAAETEQLVAGCAETDLLARLVDLGLVETDLGPKTISQDLLQDMQLSILARSYAQENPAGNFVELSNPQRMQWVHRLGDALPETYFELEWVRRRLGQGTHIPAADLSDEVRLMCARPKRDLSPAEQMVVRHLLVRMRVRPTDVHELYAVDKNLFFEYWRSWPKSFQDWAAAHVAERYEPRMLAQ